MDGPFGMGIGLRITVINVTAHQRATAVGKILSNHRDSMTCSVMAVSFFPQLLHNLLISKVAMLTGMDVIY